MSLLFGKRVPWFLRASLTASSVLAGVLFASAFSYGPPGPAAVAVKSPVAVAVSAPAPDVHAAQLKSLAASKAHQDHLNHLGQLKAAADQERLAVLQAQVRKIVKPRPKPHTSTPAVGSAPKTSTTSTTAVASAAPAATYKGSSAMQQCIISRESGGNPNAMNASGHYGLYQFSYSTWVGSGGAPGDFGHASVAEQNQVFANAVAARGYSDWTPYDGC